MTEIVSVRFRSGGKEYYFDPKGLRVKPGDEVIIETAKGPEFGICCRGNAMVEDDKVVKPLRPLVRLATDKDRETLRRNREREKEALRICGEKVAEYKLDMDLVRCECSFDGNKLLFFFISEGRVDFRALVKDLASTIHARIELRQIGVRDEAKMLGGLGICGRPFCCSQFLDEFQPVCIKMAKTQNLSLNPTKISGTCGRLMCCLKYEQEAYEDLVKHAPKQESFVETPDGAGTVSSVNLLRQTVQVRLESAPETPKCYHNCEICVIRNGKGKRPEDYVEPPLEELAKRRRQSEEDIPAIQREEEALAAALEAAFPSDMNRTKEPAQPTEDWEEQALPAEGEEEPKRSSRNRRRRRRGSRPEGEAPKADQPEGEAKPARREKKEGAPEGAAARTDRPRRPRPPKPAQVEGEKKDPVPAAEGGEEKKNPRRRRRRRPRGNGGAAPIQE